MIDIYFTYLTYLIEREERIEKLYTRLFLGNNVSSLRSPPFMETQDHRPLTGQRQQKEILHQDVTEERALIILSFYFTQRALLSGFMGKRFKIDFLSLDLLAR